MLRGEAKKAPHKRAAKPAMTAVLRVRTASRTSRGEALAGRDQAAAIAYAIAAKVAKNDLLSHPSFGVGVVTDLSDDKKKATVLFEAGETVLTVGRLATTYSSPSPLPSSPGLMRGIETMTVSPVAERSRSPSRSRPSGP